MEDDVVSRTIRISEAERQKLVAGESFEFPKYTTQIMNTANQNSQATRPNVVGQMSDIVDEFRDRHPDGTFEDWRVFYYEEYSGEERIDEATDRMVDMVEKMTQAAQKIDEEMIRDWVRDLVLYKTYEGLGVQTAILRKLAKEYDREFERSTSADESKGIDGFLGDQPVSIKPETYEGKSRLQEDIDAPIVYYEEYSTSNALSIDVSGLDEAMGKAPE